MDQETIKTLFKEKILKILTLLLLIRVGLYIPVPGVDLDIFEKGQSINPFFSFAKTLVGNSFLGIGTLGILPYINASIIIQLVTPLFPSLEKLQKEDGALGRQQLQRYTRYLTFIWALGLSTGIAVFLIKPICFDWSILLGLKIVISLTVGSILSMWFAELITEKGLGNGSSMIIFVNIVGGIPNNLSAVGDKILGQNLFDTFLLLFKDGVFYFFIVLTIIFFQDSYKKIQLISARQLSTEVNESSKNLNSFIPLKLNQGGIMPLVFSSTVSTALIIPAQLALSSISSINNSLGVQIITLYSFALNTFLIVFFSCFYVSLVLKPKDMADNLSKMAYGIPNVRPGRATITYLEKISNRLAFVSGVFLAALTFFPIILGNFFQFTLFKNLTSLLILIGVITDTTSQIQGYLISSRYGIKKT
uniref:preprotein translocase subunit SecY n=1 Tax=Chrysotila carterae TaxID=13221 RepID=UPI0022F2E683|nr:preprotein translocase subunit SecY [Chrysotila carterae]WAK83177.1 preprotein translocase subunit SecY [Chrysotila carterae]